MFTWLHWIILIPNASAGDWKVILELVLNLLGFVWDIWGRSCCCAALWSSQCPAECVVVLQSLTAERKVCLQPHWCPPSGRRHSDITRKYICHTQGEEVRPGNRSSSSPLSSGCQFTLSPQSFLFDSPSSFLSSPLPPAPPLPLKGTLLRWTVCVTRWAGHTQWDTQLSGCPCVYTCVSVFAVSTLGSLSSLHMKMYFKWCVLSPLSLHTHTNMNTVITSQWSSSAGSRERRWSCRLMDMFVYLFVLDMINWSAG